MKPYLPFIFGLVIIATPLTAVADCGLNYKACANVCKVKHFGNDSANAGCVSKCVGKQGACLAKTGAKKTAKVGKKAWTSTKSFFKGLSND